MERQPIEVFFSYSREDKPLRDKLEIHLSSLRQQGVISSWHDRQIVAGSEWEEEIDRHMRTADIILLLVSPDFVNSKYCYDIELPYAMRRHEAGEAYVVPILLRPVARWKNLTFTRLQVYPSGGVPITQWADPDNGFVDVAEGIAEAVEKLLERRQEIEQLRLEQEELAKRETERLQQAELDRQEAQRLQQAELDRQEAQRLQQAELDREEAPRLRQAELYRQEAQRLQQAAERSRLSEARKTREVKQTKQEKLENTDVTQAYAIARIRDHKSGQMFYTAQIYQLQAGIRSDLTQGFKGIPIQLLNQEEPVQLEIIVWAEDMEVEPDWMQPYFFSQTEKNPLVEFKLKPTQLGRKEIRVEFLYQRHWLAKIEFEVEVVDTRQSTSSSWTSRLISLFRTLGR